MTTLREAAQQALEAMEKATRYMSDSDYRKLNEAIDTLHAALAEPVQEPVAWMVYTLDGKSVCVTDNPDDFTDQHRALPLYAAPPQRPAEPVQEPVAWLWQHRETGRTRVLMPDKRTATDVAAAWDVVGPLYLAPPQRLPLTEEEIAAAAKSVPAAVYELMHGHEITVEKFRAALAEFARAVERAHGIGGKDD